MGRSKKQSVISGYWYGLSMHMALCHGPVDAITEVMVGDKTAWSGEISGNETVSISNRSLFGGEEREGGVDGALTVMMGATDQPANAYLAGKTGQAIGYRGVASVLWQGLVAAMNPYIKPWRFRVKRIPSAWNPSYADIAGDANPAHILRECLTNRDWGMGYPEADIDEESFTRAARTLYDEGFGLSLLWSEETSIEDFVLSILRHIDGTLYVHPNTGFFMLVLARDDYDPESLMVLSPGNVIVMEEFSRRGWGELVNQVTVQYRDGATDKDASVTIQDIAAIEMQGGVVAHTVRYPGISKAHLALRVAQRELRQLSSNLARLRLVANRQASKLAIGACFKLVWPEYGIDGAVFRIARIDYGDYADGRVRIEAVEDVFYLPTAAYAAPPPSGWTDPVSAPAPCPAQLLYEVPYWQVVKDLVGESPTLLSEIDANEGLVAALGSRPSPDAFAYTAYEWRAYPYDRWESAGSGAFAPTALIVGAMPQAAEDVEVTLSNAVDFGRVTAYDWLAVVDEEWMWVTGVDPDAGRVTLARGVLDTVPLAHAAGSRLWFVAPHYLETQYVYGDLAQVILCPRTPKGELEKDRAATLMCPIDRRFIRPYPPGSITLNGVRYPTVVAKDITIAWAHRNRINQTAEIVRQTDGNITPEAEQTVSIRIYGGETLDILRRSYVGLVDTSQTWTMADIVADGAASDGRIKIEIESSRADAVEVFVSWQKHVIETDRAGWGLQWGNYYGGI